LDILRQCATTIPIHYPNSTIHIQAITCILAVDSIFTFLLAIIDFLVWDELNPVNFVYPLMLCASMVSHSQLHPWP
jgi:hypothetical protein